MAQLLKCLIGRLKFSYQYMNGHLFDARKSLGFVKGTANPLQPCIGPEGSRRLRFPNFKTVGDKVVSPAHRPPLLVLTSVRG